MPGQKSLSLANGWSKAMRCGLALSRLPSSALLLFLCVAPKLFGCGGATEAVPIEVLPPPERSAAEDRRVRLLLLDLAEAQLCDLLNGAFMALPDADAAEGREAGLSPAAGRLWVKECEVKIESRQSIQEARLALKLAGPGWTWVEQSAPGPLGTSFTVRGHLRFFASMSLTGVLDVAYDDRNRLVSLWMSPRTPASATVAPRGAIPVEPDGGWSSLIASIGSWFGPNLEERAAPMVEEQGSRRMAEQLSEGFTFTVNLCSGQLDAMVGPLSNGTTPLRPYPAGQHVWHQNLRARLRSEGLEIAGPFPPTGNPLRLDMEVEAGSPVRVSAYCADVGASIVEDYLDALQEEDRERAGSSTRPAVSPIWRTRVSPGRNRAYQIPSVDCPTVLVTEPAVGAPDDTVLRYRVFDQGAEIQSWVSCPGLSS